MGDREITYTVDRQGKPAMLSKKESIAQQIINGIFMVPGNLPNLPIGVDIESYLYSAGAESEDVTAKLERTCGTQFMSRNVGNINCSVINYDGCPTICLEAVINVDTDTKDSLGLVVTNQDNAVRFNHKFMSDGIKKAYGT